nr:hypothetical protein [uncultured Erwinia sp.]
MQKITIATFKGNLPGYVCTCIKRSDRQTRGRFKSWLPLFAQRCGLSGCGIGQPAVLLAEINKLGKKQSARYSGEFKVSRAGFWLKAAFALRKGGTSLLRVEGNPRR